MKIGLDQDISLIVKLRATSRVISGVIFMVAILFMSAGRWDFWHGWVYLLLWIYVELFIWLIVPSEILQERIKPGPGTKKWDYVFLASFFPLTYIIPLIAALDGGRHHWTGDFPQWVNVAAFVVILLGYSLMIQSLWKNRFFSATVRIQKERGHCVVDKGPYALIRHPGYAGLIVSSFAIPIALNSLWGLVPAGLYAIALVIRTYLEDVTLQKELPGYVDYAGRVRYRLIPRIW